jgi:hypothetical protein
MFSKAVDGVKSSVDLFCVYHGQGKSSAWYHVSSTRELRIKEIQLLRIQIAMVQLPSSPSRPCFLVKKSCLGSNISSFGPQSFSADYFSKLGKQMLFPLLSIVPYI